jgi:transcriptional regulator with XRE-family HTH domain
MQKRNVSIVLRELLDQRPISPTELHRRTGVPQSTLSRILSGKIVDPSDKHISIAEYFASAPTNCAARGGGRLRDDGRDPMHSELKDISLWDDDTPVNDDEVSIPFCARLNWLLDQEDSSSKKARRPACASASAACGITACSSTRPSA